MASRLSLSSGASVSKKAPRLGLPSFSRRVDNLCTMIPTTRNTVRILPPTQAPAVSQMYSPQKKLSGALSNGSRTGLGLETLTSHKSSGEAPTMLDVQNQPRIWVVGRSVTSKFVVILELVTAPCNPSMMDLRSGGWMP